MKEYLVDATATIIDQRCVNVKANNAGEAIKLAKLEFKSLEDVDPWAKWTIDKVQEVEPFEEEVKK
jgi:hypothetical protein